MGGGGGSSGATVQMAAGMNIKFVIKYEYKV